MSHQKGADSRSKASRNLVRIVAQREGVSRVFSERGNVSRFGFRVSSSLFREHASEIHRSIGKRNPKPETRNSKLEMEDSPCLIGSSCLASQLSL